MASQIAQKKQNEREFLLECVHLYKDLPALWNLKSREYRDRKLKNNSYEILLHKYRQFYPDADKNDLKKRLNSLRSNFRKELRKVREYEKSGFTYESSLWYYNDLSFLYEQEINGNLDSSVDEDIDNKSAATPEVHYVVTKTESEYISDNIYKCSEQTTCLDKGRNCNIQFEVDDQSNKEDDFECIAKMWANDLRKMDRIQQILARKAINEILLDGLLGNLQNNPNKKV